MSVYNVLLTCVLIVFVLMMFFMIILKNIFDKYIYKIKLNFLVTTLVILSIGFLIFSFFTPYYFTENDIGATILFDNETAEKGDSIGGFMNPFIAISGVIITFLAFYIQYEFNRTQSQLIDDQKEERKEDEAKRDTQIAKEYFDKKFYELLKIHIENVKEFNIANKILSRKCFVYMLKELKGLYFVIDSHVNFLEEEERDKVNKIDLAYSIFFNGIGSIDDSNLKLDGICEKKSKEFLEKLKFDLKTIQDIYYSEEDDGNGIRIVSYTYLKGENEFSFYPYDGHSNRLGHYYRHLFHFLEVIDNSNAIDDNEKQMYVKLLRAQMSDYEQALLYYNAIAWYDDKWDSYFKKYTLIKNITKELTDFHSSPEELFKAEIAELKESGIKMFQWVELDSEE